MHDISFPEVPAGLGPVLAERGFTELTPIQTAVLDPDVIGRDLRISSQTGSGKTVALGLVAVDVRSGLLGSERRDLDDLAAGEEDVGQPEAAPDETAVAEYAAYLFRMGIGGHVEILGFAA